MTPAGHPTGVPAWLPEAQAKLGDLLDQGDDSRARHSLDAWPLAVKRARAGMAVAWPAAVCRPRTAADVVRVVTWAASRRIPVVPWGGGSSVTGAPLPASDSLVLDIGLLNRIISVDAVSCRVRAEAGVFGGDLERALAVEGLTTRFSPQSLGRSTVGGWVATGATGQLSTRFGGIEDAVVGLSVVLPDGELVEVGGAPRAAIGPHLPSLFVGSEGALGVITEVELRAYRNSPLRGHDSFALPGVSSGLKVLREIIALGLRPALLRLYDPTEARYLDLPAGCAGAVLLVSFIGPEPVVVAEGDAVAEVAVAERASRMGPAPVETWLATRYDFSRVERLLEEPGGYAETIEVAHTWRHIGRTYGAMREALAPLSDEVLGHFSHAYADGTSLYLTALGHAADDREAVARLEGIWEAAMRACLECGAAISHHHGVGRARMPWLGEQLGSGATVLARLKQGLDPAGTLHPGGAVASCVPAAAAVSETHG
jgi:alkyldihydroxyacetonephosphate synthase